MPSRAGWQIDNDLEIGSASLHDASNTTSRVPNSITCIYRVPDRMRRVKPEAYTPQILLIGPLHYFKEANADGNSSTHESRYSEMEELKSLYVSEFNKRMKDTEYTSTRLRTSIEKKEKEIRQCYAEQFTGIESVKFVDMILHDSIFILEVFLRYYEVHDRGRHLDDKVLNDPHTAHTVYTDLILFENQIPYSHMEKLFEPLLKTLYDGKTTFRTLVLTYFGKLMIKQTSSRFKTYFRKLVRHSHSYDATPFKHFTDLFRWAIVERPDSKLHEIPKQNMPTIKYLPNATELYGVGVSFKPHRYVPSLDRITFKRGCLKLPTFVANEATELILRNTMALEQCCYKEATYLCNYARLMDFLVETESDVELLVKKGIIENRLGQKDRVADMVNTLCIGVWEVGSLYCDIAKKLNTYSQNHCIRSYGYLRRFYFPNVWAGTATIAATLLLIMTLVQTVSSVIQVRQGFKK